MTLFAQNPFGALARLITAAGNQSRPAYQDRAAVYDMNQQYYDNAIYERGSEGGLREQINATLGNASAADLAGLYNPVAEVVGLYQHVFGGLFRRSTDDAAEDAPTDIRAQSDNAALLPALDAIWATSNMDLAKQQIARLAPMHGTVGLRIVAQDSPDPARRRVYLKPEHPRVIRDVELDPRGHVTGAELEYDILYGLGDAQERVTIREVLSKEDTRTYRVHQNGLIPYDLMLREDNGPGAIYVNTLGVVPYVLLPHEDAGDAFGLNAFYRARSSLDRLNALLTHLNTQIHDHVKVDWFISASGPAPTRIALTGRNVIYTDTSRGQTAPNVQALVADLNIADAISQCRLLIELIEDRLPELKALGGRYLSGQSGETIAQLRAPAEQRLGLARANYEAALVRATQIAVSWGVLLGMWNVGTGQGTPEAAERAYRDGFEEFRFNRRPLFPPVARQDTSQASADFANRVNSAGTLIRSGFTPGDSLTVAGLPPVAHTGLLPVTVQRPDGGAAINAAGNVTGRPDATTEEPTP